MRLAAVMMVIAPSLALATPVTYRLDPGESEIVALTKPAGLLGGAAHPHVIAARDPAGTIVYDPDAPEHSTVEVRLAAGALENDDPALRQKYGLEGAIGEGDRRKIAENMRSRSQLDVEHHPDVTFTSRSVRPLEDGRLEVSGRLAIHGVEADVTLPVRVTVEGGVLRGEGTTRIGHRTFGIKPYSAGLGTIRNADGIELHVLLVGRAATDGTAAGTGP
jgi:polyisoprenoid-binding protein YceI